jgi:MFS family permease
VLGTCNGYLTVVMLTILQEATPARLMGRMMSLVTLAGVGLAPLSQAAAGVAVRYGAERVFVVVGALLIVTAVGCMTRPELRHMRRWDVKA